MCRFTLYLGPEIAISKLVTEPSNSLINQSFHSREREEPLNGDGFGVAWYAPEAEGGPALFRSLTPAWSNSNLYHLARVVRSPCVLAHVRAATQVRAVSEANCHPFVHGRYAFMHNGDVGGFDRVRRPLLNELSEDSFKAIGGTTDSEHLFAMFLDEIATRDGTTKSMAEALRRTFARVSALVAQYGGGEHSYLNVAVSNGLGAVVTRYTSDPTYPGESLHFNRGRRYVCEDGLCRMVMPSAEGAAVLVSAETLSDDPSWEDVPPNHLVVIDEYHAVSVQPI